MQNKSHVDEYSLLRVKVGIDKVVRCTLSAAAWIGYIHVDLLPNGAQSLTPILTSGCGDGWAVDRGPDLVSEGEENKHRSRYE